jgi:hypothetical protein
VLRSRSRKELHHFGAAPAPAAPAPNLMFKKVTNYSSLFYFSSFSLEIRPPDSQAESLKKIFDFCK